MSETTVLLLKLNINIPLKMEHVKLTKDHSKSQDIPMLPEDQYQDYNLLLPNNQHQLPLMLITGHSIHQESFQTVEQA